MDDATRSTEPATLEDRVLTEQVALMCRLTTATLFGSLMVGAMLALVVLEDHGWGLSVAWYAAVSVATVARWRVARAFGQRVRTPSEARRWRNAMLLLAGIVGATWSIAGTALLPSSIDKQVIVAVIFIGATASAMNQLAPVKHAFAALLVPFVLPYALYQLTLGSHRTVLGLAFLLYIPVILALARRQTQVFEEQIRLAIKNEELVEELRRERDRTQRINKELQAQIEQQRRSSQRIRSLNRHLEAQTAELRAANQDLEGFSYSVSHDLRGPLRAIDGFSHLLQERTGHVDSVQAAHYLARIRDNVARMAMLIDDLLAFAHYGRQSIDWKDLDMDALARDAADQVLAAQPSAAACSISIEPLPAARGDSHLLLQVWVNLLDNAVKYSSKVAQPHIVVSGREEGARVLFEVTDNGVGFDSRYSDTLFGVFQRLHGAGEYPGTGVGLAIVQRIVLRHGGEVWARSEVNRGATFGFALPTMDLAASQPDMSAPQLAAALPRSADGQR